MSAVRPALRQRSTTHLRTALHVAGMLGLGADAGDARVVEEFFDEPIFVGRKILEDLFWNHNTWLLSQA